MREDRRGALTQDKIVAPAKSVAEMSRIVRNDYIDAALSGLFIFVAGEYRGVWCTCRASRSPRNPADRARDAVRSDAGRLADGRGDSLGALIVGGTRGGGVVLCSAARPARLPWRTRCSPIFGKQGDIVGQAMRLMVGLPDYDNYVSHMQATHPDRPVMTYERIFPREAGSAVSVERREGAADLIQSVPAGLAQKKSAMAKAVALFLLRSQNRVTAIWPIYKMTMDI